MAVLDDTWALISGKAGGCCLKIVRSELLNCCAIGLLLHTNLKAGLSEVTTASGASMTGGAVGQSRELTLSGSSFAAADRAGLAGEK